MSSMSPLRGQTSHPQPRRNALHFALLAFFLLLFALLSHQSLVLAQEGPLLEERAQALDRQLICPVCPGETLNQSQATLAKQMRQILRDRLADGQTEQEITDYFVSVYGEMVLAAPPKRGFLLTAWLVPPAALLAGITVLVLTIRKLRRPSGLVLADGPETPNDVELEPYLDLVDEEMADNAEKDQRDAPGRGAAPWRR